MSGSTDSGTRDWTVASVYALVLLTLVSTLNYFDRSVLSLMLPLIKKDFHVSDTTLGVVAGMIAIYAILGVPVAWLAERWSRRNIVAIGLASWSLMTMLTGLVTNVWQLGGARFAMAIGESAGLAPSQSILSDLFSKRARPVVLSIITTAVFRNRVFLPKSRALTRHSQVVTAPSTTGWSWLDRAVISKPPPSRSAVMRCPTSG